MFGELLVGQLGERGGAADEGGELADGRLADGGDVGDQLLGEHIERVAQVASGLDAPVEHPPRDHRRLEQVAAVLGVDRAPAGLADLVAGSPDPLQAAADGAGRLDLDHEVDGAHVDAELEAARGDDAAQACPA